MASHLPLNVRAAVRHHAGSRGPVPPPLSPPRHQVLVRTRQLAQLRRCLRPRFPDIALMEAEQEPGDLGEQVGPPARDLLQFG